MAISEKKLNSNRKNLEIGRIKSLESRQKRKHYNNELIECEIVCERCGCLFTKMLRRIDAEKKRFPRFCSRSCANSRVRTAELRKHLSELNMNRCWVNGKLQKVTRYCKGCGRELQFGVHVRRSFCSDECRIQYYIRNKNNSVYKSKRQYKDACRFLFDVYDYPNEFDLSLIQKYGWYSPVNKHNNPDGVSRDHMYSISAGYKNKVPATILAHPANCRIILQKDNFEKLSKCSITLDELNERIREWNEKYGTYVPKSHK